MTQDIRTAALLPKKILIIEDQREKSIAIRECLAEALPDYLVEQTDTVHIAGQLLSVAYSGVVLDLSFRRTQQVSGQGARPVLAGLEVLQQLNEMRLDCPVIVATQHPAFFSTKYGDFESIDDLKRMLARAFPANYRELIKVDLGGGEWREALVRATRRYFK